MAGTAQYLATIENWRAKTREKLEAIARQSIQTLCEAIIIDTPVHTGFLRGGWQPSIGAMPPRKDVSPDPGGGQGMADAAAAIQGFKAGETFYFANGVIYARRVNYGFVGTDSLGRHYNQAGQFFLDNNLARWQEIVSATAAELK